jgi:probable F420-dependent oxidoreductase
MPAVRFVLVLSENWTLTSGRDLPVLVRWAREAEDAGFDAVMLSEHVVLGRSAGENGVMANPREYALPGNQPPDTPWPSSLLLLSAIAAVTERVRLAASAVITPLRHPLLLAKELATLDALSGGRLVVQPTVSWHRDEYAALGVAFTERGARLDEQLEVWAACWQAAAQGAPVSHRGRFWSFDDVWVSPGPAREQGPQLWFGGETLHDALLRRLVRYGNGYNPLGRPPEQDTERLAAALVAAGRPADDLELVGGTRARFPGPDSCADLAETLEQLPGQVEQGFTTFCMKPSQFTDDPDGVGAFCREVVTRTERLLA